jgi:hypothetical protein
MIELIGLGIVADQVCHCQSALNSAP